MLHSVKGWRMIDFEKEEEFGGIGMKKYIGLLCVLAVCLSLTACSAEEALVDILSKAIAQALEENNMSLPDESSEETAEGTEVQNAGENGADSNRPLRRPGGKRT